MDKLNLNSSPDMTLETIILSRILFCEHHFCNQIIGDIKPTFYSGVIKLKIEKLLKTELNTLF